MQVDDAVLDELLDRGRNVFLEEVVMLVERAHSDPGVARERLDAYGDALTERAGYRFEHFEGESFGAALDERVADAETWAGRTALYELGDGRVSRYPPNWHENVGGVADPREWVRFLRATDSDFLDGLGAAGAGDGVAEDELLDAIATVGRVPRSDAKARLEELREAGEVVEDADQHPDAGVRLAENVDGLGDPDAP